MSNSLWLLQPLQDLDQSCPVLKKATHLNNVNCRKSNKFSCRGSLLAFWWRSPGCNMYIEWNLLRVYRIWEGFCNNVSSSGFSDWLRQTFTEVPSDRNLRCSYSVLTHLPVVKWVLSKKVSLSCLWATFLFHLLIWMFCRWCQEEFTKYIHFTAILSPWTDQVFLNTRIKQLLTSLWKDKW